MVQSGDIIAGKYRVDRVLGKGAMGIVVAAEHVDLGALRAIKLMRHAFGIEQEAEDRFMREARATVHLKSKHAVQVMDVGRLESGDPYIVMEYLEGTDLKALLDQRRMLPPEEAVSYLLQACEALAEAHALGIIHRDLKPANLFLSTGVGGAPCVKVLDFGIAKLMGHSGAGVDMNMTSTGAIMGTPYYMSPEQIRSSKDVDAQADIWSLGVILYRLVTGRLPFDAEGMGAMMNVVMTCAPSPPSSLNPDLPAGLEAVILRCLEKKPGRRFQSVVDLAQALARFGPEEMRWSLPGLFRSPSMVEIEAATQRMRPSSTQTVQPGAAPPAGAPATQRLSGRERGDPASSAARAPEGQTNASWAQRTGRDDAQRTKRIHRLSALVGALAVAAMAALIVIWLQRGPEPDASAFHGLDASSSAPRQDFSVDVPPSPPPKEAPEEPPLSAAQMATEPGRISDAPQSPPRTPPKPTFVPAAPAAPATEQPAGNTTASTPSPSATGQVERQSAPVAAATSGAVPAPTGSAPPREEQATSTAAVEKVTGATAAAAPPPVVKPSPPGEPLGSGRK